MIGSVLALLLVTSAACGGAEGADGGAPPANDSTARAAAAPVVGADTGGPGDGETAAAAPAAAAPTVLVAGTSLTAGLGLDPSQAYPALLQRKADSAGLRVRVVNAGLSGETSAGLLRRIDWLLREPAAVVVIETGANDGLRAQDPEQTKANLLAIVRRVREAQPAARVFVVQMEAPPNLGTRYTTRFRAVFPEVARETGATLIPFLLEGVAGVDSLNQPDGIHPNARGAERVAETVWRAVAPTLAQVADGA